MSRAPATLQVVVAAGLLLGVAPGCGRERSLQPTSPLRAVPTTPTAAPPVAAGPASRPQLRARPGLAPVQPPPRRALLAPSAADVARLAAALGLHPPARPADGAWTAADGRRQLRVAAGPGGRWQVGPSISGCAPCPGPAPCAPCPSGAGAPTGGGGSSSTATAGTGPLATGAEAVARRIGAATGYEVRAVIGATRASGWSADVLVSSGGVAVTGVLVHVEASGDGTVTAASGPLGGLGPDEAAGPPVAADVPVSAAAAGAWSSCTPPAGAVCPPAAAAVVAMAPAWRFEADHLAPSVELRLDDGSSLVVAP